MAGVHASAKSLESKLKGPNEQSAPLQRQHPRRTPPRDAKILPGHKKQKVSHSPEKADTSAVPMIQVLKSQGSGSDESANRWFDKSNKHIPQSARASNGYDDEPPFFMSNQANYLPNTFDTSDGSRMFGVQSRLDSENEELRSVIDDLTVENKRLKQVLRVNNRSQRNTPSTDGQDKLFEVRMHGLSSEKRRELEFLLKNFATSVHTSAPSQPNSTADSAVSSLQNNNKAKTDSGYASNSNSGQPSLTAANASRGNPRVSRSIMDVNIKNYLHDIPDTLLPRQQPMVMSERARMALVVRRLEQLFTGRKASPGEHSQPLQQQELSHMAARADAKNSKKRKAEGKREAHVLPHDTKVNLDNFEPGPELKKKFEPKTLDGDMSASDAAALGISRPGSPDQRPTRPLDLDIHRAQVAADNIKYIRHLGLNSPQLDSNDSSESWMYLNLLTGMAQMHTINVTPAFVRKAIKKLSTKFELSKDGHRVRWIGGPEGTVFSREEEKALEVADNKDTNSTDECNEDTGTGGSSKRSKTDSNSNAMASGTTESEDKTSGQISDTNKQQISTNATSPRLSSLQTHQSQTGSAFDYKPIVFRQRHVGTAPADSYLDSDSSLGDTSRDSSGLAHALSRSNLNQQRHADEGLITFYNNPHFCSDYSGDKLPSNMIKPRDATAGLVLGIQPDTTTNDLEQTSRLAKACYFYPQFGPEPFSEVSEDKIPELRIEPLSGTPQEEIEPRELPVSGLGGVVPDDNFAIDVNIHMEKAASQDQGPSIGRIAYTGRKIKSEYQYKKGECSKIDLLPSRLPPASYVFFTSSSSSGNQLDDYDDEEDDSSVESDETSSSTDDDSPPIAPSFLRHWTTQTDGNMAVDNQDQEDQDDSSVDFLADVRAVDPVRIAEQERQYMINQPGSRAVAGSLAATVGASRSATSADSNGTDRVEVVSQGDEDSDVSMGD